MAKGIGKSIDCDGCGDTLTDYHGASLPGVVIHDSIVFGARNVVLCAACSKHEFEEEAKHGTNDLPHLLKRYQEKKYAPEE